jgi:hypothetical protein
VVRWNRCLPGRYRLRHRNAGRSSRYRLSARPGMSAASCGAMQVVGRTIDNGPGSAYGCTRRSFFEQPVGYRSGLRSGRAQSDRQYCDEIKSEKFLLRINPCYCYALRTPKPTSLIKLRLDPTKMGTRDLFQAFEIATPHLGNAIIVPVRKRPDSG